MHNPVDSNLRWADARILIVDDDPSNARLLSRILGRAGYRDVHVLLDGRRAMGVYAELEPALVLLDLARTARACERRLQRNARAAQHARPRSAT